MASNAADEERDFAQNREVRLLLERRGVETFGQASAASKRGIDHEAEDPKEKRQECVARK